MSPQQFRAPPALKNKTSQGIGVQRDPARARELYHEAHDAGSPAAAYFLGHRSHVGDEELGIEADGVRALQLLRHASEQVGPTHESDKVPLRASRRFAFPGSNLGSFSFWGRWS